MRVEPARAYDRRRPEKSLLYAVVQAELEGFLAHAEARERPVPRWWPRANPQGDGGEEDRGRTRHS